MPSINLRQLRDTRQLKAWLRAGQTVELRERDTVLGRIVPGPEKRPSPPMPDFLERAKAVTGGRMIEMTDWLIRQRWDDPE